MLPGYPAGEAAMRPCCPTTHAPVCRDARERYVMAYWNRDISYGYLSRRVPFVALELTRLKRLRPEDP